MAVLGWTFDGALVLGWYGFVGWRKYHAVAMPADRRYDRKGKHAIPPEYAATESATVARERRRRRKR